MNRHSRSGWRETDERWLYANNPEMKIFLAMGVMAGFAAVLALGIVMAVQGSFWLLLAGVGVFGLLFWRFGCTEA